MMRKIVVLGLALLVALMMGCNYKPYYFGVKSQAALGLSIVRISWLEPGSWPERARSCIGRVRRMRPWRS
jgi:hypothetical protein